MIPNRIRTGFKNRTIPNPTTLAREVENPREVFKGKVEGYNFRKQKDQFEKLGLVLAQHGVVFTEVAGLLYDGDRGYNQRFVVLTNKPEILWYKYVGFAAQGGQNHLWLHGRRVKVSVLLGAHADIQKALITNKVPAKHRHVVQRCDEAGTLWS